MSHTPICKIARITGKTGRTAELRGALLALEVATRAEPGCREFRFYQSLTDSDEFVLLEHFVDVAAFEAHMKQPHTRDFFAAQLVEHVKAFDVPALDGD